MQQKVVAVITESLSEKVKSKVSLNQIEWRFPNSFVLNDVFIEDQSQDTLLFIDRTKVTINILELFRAKVSFRTIQLTGMNAYINKDTSNLYNFQFFIDAFRQKEERDSLAIKWSMDVESIAFNDCAVSYLKKGNIVKKQKQQFNPENIKVSSLNGSLYVRSFTEDSINVKLHNISFIERSGLTLRSLSTTMVSNSEKLDLYNFVALMPESRLSLNNATFYHKNFEAFHNFIEEMTLSLDVAPSYIKLTDLAAFVPAFETLNESLVLEGEVNGTISQLFIHNFLLKYGGSVKAQGDFFLKGLLDVKKMYVYADIKEIAASSGDIVHIAQAFSKKKIKLPVFMDSLGVLGYSGEIKGFLTELEAKGVLTSAAGFLFNNVLLKTDANLNFNEYTVKGKINTKSYRLARLFGYKSQLGNTTFKLDVELVKSGKNRFSLNALGIIDSLTYRKYRYENISINGKFNDNGFDGSLIMSDKNAELSFKGNIDLHKEKPVFRFVANIQNVKLANLNLVKKYPNSSLSLDIETNFIGKTLDDIEGSFSIDNLMFTHDDKELLINNFSLTAITQEDSSKKVTLYSDYINGYLKGQYLFTTIFDNLQNIAHQYVPSIVKEKVEIEHGKKRNNFSFKFTIDNTEPISEVIEMPMVFLEESTLSGFYNDNTDKFRIRMESPQLQIGKINMGNFILLCENPEDYIKLMLRTTHLPQNKRRNPYFISLNSKIAKDTINLDAHFSNSTEITYSGSISLVSALKDFTQEGLTADIYVKPTDIILNDTVWNIHESKIELQPKNLRINNFFFNHANQYLKINGINSVFPEDSVHIHFGDFQLGYISDILNQKSISFNGIADGDIYLFQLFKKPYFKGEINIYDVFLNDYLLGDLSVNTAWKEADKCIAFESKLQGMVEGKVVQSDIIGGVFTGNDSLYIEGRLKDVDLKFLRQYIGSVMQNNTGTASGTVKAYGKFGKIGLEGTAVVKNMAFDVDYLNTSYVISDTVFMTPTSFRLNQSQVYDSEGNYAVASGLVLHEGFRNFKFAVNLSCDNLLALNTSEQDNELFYGKAFAKGNVGISGTPDVVNFNLNLRTMPNTKITVPIGGTSNVGEADFITFVESTDNLTATEKRRLRREKLKKIKENQKSGTEMNLNINLEATPDAQIQLIMDPRQGDMIRGTGTGNLRLLYNTKESDFKMYGSYEIYKGEYLFTIQSIISRKFEITEGSLVRWTGNPYDASIDIKAKYILNASLTEILDDPNLRSSITPVHCLLDLTGTIDRPTIKFDLELPNSDDEVRRKLRSIINTEESMNRNIASLLALGHFYTMDRSSSNSNELSSVGFSTLSSQLSNWISSINNDINIGVNYRPVSDGVTTSNEFDVALSTQFLNDRLLLNGNFGYREDVSNSPNVSNSIVDFDLEYKLSRSGKLRVKGFNRSNNSYFKQSPNTQGVGLIYREDFDTFGELMRSYWNPVQNLFKGNLKKPEEVTVKTEGKREKEKK